MMISLSGAKKLFAWTHALSRLTSKRSSYNLSKVQHKLDHPAHLLIIEHIFCHLSMIILHSVSGILEKLNFETLNRRTGVVQNPDLTRCFAQVIFNVANLGACSRPIGLCAERKITKLPRYRGGIPTAICRLYTCVFRIAKFDELEVDTLYDWPTLEIQSSGRQTGCYHIYFYKR